MGGTIVEEWCSVGFFCTADSLQKRSWSSQIMSSLWHSTNHLSPCSSSIMGFQDVYNPSKCHLFCFIFTPKTWEKIHVPILTTKLYTVSTELGWWIPLILIVFHSFPICQICQLASPPPFAEVKAVLGAFLDLRLYLHKASKEMLWIDPQLSRLGWSPHVMKNHEKSEHIINE